MKIEITVDIANNYFKTCESYALDPNLHLENALELQKEIAETKWIRVKDIFSWAKHYPEDTFEDFLLELGCDEEK